MIPSTLSAFYKALLGDERIASLSWELSKVAERDTNTAALAGAGAAGATLTRVPQKLLNKAAIKSLYALEKLEGRLPLRERLKAMVEHRHIILPGKESQVTVLFRRDTHRAIPGTKQLYLSPTASRGTLEHELGHLRDPDIIGPFSHSPYRNTYRTLRNEFVANASSIRRRGVKQLPIAAASYGSYLTHAAHKHPRLAAAGAGTLSALATKRLLHATHSKDAAAADADALFRRAQATQKKMLPVLHRERERLDKQFKASFEPFSSVHMGINLPDEGASDIDLNVGVHDVAAFSKRLSDAGIPFTKSRDNTRVHTYNTPEGYEVELKVRPKAEVDYQIPGRGRILALPDHTKARFIKEKYDAKMSGDPDRYNAMKYRLYEEHGMIPAGGDWSSVTKKAEVEYHGKTFPGYNQPISSDQKDKKMMVLAKKGDEVRLLHFGQEGYQHNYSPEAKANYLKRSAGIRNKSGQLTKDDKLSPNYWARRVLWPRGETGGGSNGPINLKAVAPRKKES